MSLSCYLTSNESPNLSSTCTGLGNNLFQIASAYSIAKQTGKVANLWSVPIFNEKLKILTGSDYSKTIFRNVPWSSFNGQTGIVDVPHAYHGDFAEALVNYIKNSPMPDLCLSGYLESHLFFGQHEEEIRQMFQPDPESLNFIKEKYPFLFKEVPCTSIHIRNFHPNFKDDMEYIKRALEHVPSDSMFVIISNDIENVRKDMTFLPGRVEYIEGNPDFIDLWVMSLCSYNILSHSTMSWWGAFLNQTPAKTVVCPKTMQITHPGPLDNFYFKNYIVI
jgi:hypothetical protein